MPSDHHPASEPLTLSIAIPSPLRRLFDYLPAETTATHDNDTPPTPGTRFTVSFGAQKPLVGVLVSAERRTSPYKLKTIGPTLDETDKPAITTDILRLCQWCADYYHYPLGEVCHLALPTLLRKTKPLPSREQAIAWQLTAAGLKYNRDDFGRAKKQQQAWDALNQKVRIAHNELASLNLSTTTLQALSKKGLAEKKEIEKNTPLPTDFEQNRLGRQSKNPPLPLNSEQQAALDAIHFNQFACHLLDGITGSGKTEVYLQAIEKVMAKGQQALVLVPEIGLTPQTVSRFEQRFGLPVATLHSGLSDKQRLFAWQDAKAGNAPIVIGTRSSVFTPFPALGLIIVDEEHDLSYKQQEGVRYSARDTAIMRAQQQNIPIILGSATPSLETLHNALSGRFTHLRLTTRATESSLPAIHCVPSSNDQLSPTILEDIRHTIGKQQQVLVFINRRGFAPTLMCQDCHWISECTHCDSRMTIHKRGHSNTPHYHAPQSAILHCHHCDTKFSAPEQCPQCHSRRLQALGQGTQRSEEELKQHFPHVPILRIDRDSMSKKGELQATLEIINSGQPCILIGTQMLAKGHHFAKVSLAVMLGIDSGFFSSDFRGAERMGQLLTQVAGRAGRESHDGKVLLQTEFGDHPLLRQLIDHGYSALSQQLISERQTCELPPFRYIAFIRCHAHQSQLAVTFLQDAKKLCEQLITPSHTVSFIGPLPSSIEKRNNRFYYYLQIKTDRRSTLHSLLNTLCAQLEQKKTSKGLHWLVDVDPQET
ncbi:primosomal protein N' [Eionea flava]